MNGTPYQVEMEAKPAPTVKVSARPAAAPRKADGEKVISKPATSAGPGAVKAPLPGVVVTINKKVDMLDFFTLQTRYVQALK